MPTDSEMMEEDGDYPYKLLQMHQHKHQETAQLLEILKQRNNPPLTEPINNPTTVSNHRHQADTNSAEEIIKLLEESQNDTRNDELMPSKNNFRINKTEGKDSTSTEFSVFKYEFAHPHRRKQPNRNDDIINLVHINEPEKSEKNKYPSHLKRKTRRLDTYAESLLYVNRIYNAAYGFERRRVPAHMPHLLDKWIVHDMQDKFNSEFTKTSAHRVRSPQDMQFAFSYFYYLTSEKRQASTGEIFDKFDTDKSGTWSDREIRTLLSRLYPLPLDYGLVVDFENAIINCSQRIELSTTIEAPSGERYLDSTLPIVTRELIIKCDAIASKIQNQFGVENRYHHEIVKAGKNEIFDMLTSNVSQTVQLLDEIRREPKKFICLNDDMDPARKSENEVIRALLNDFYRSLYPLRSKFELPAQFRNRFSHRDELYQWRASRAKARNGLLVLVAMLLFIIIYHVFSNQIRRFLRNRSLLPSRLV